MGLSAASGDRWRPSRLFSIITSCFKKSNFRYFIKAEQRAGLLKRGLLFCFLFCSLAAPIEAGAFSSLDFYRAAKKYQSVNPFGAAVHCSHETGDWRSRLWREGKNGAGIKANSAWKALGMPYIDMESEERLGGRNVPVRSSFRKYRSLEKFLGDYSRKIREDYPVSARYNNNIWGYIGGLYKGKYGKWATDHKYFEKLALKAVKLAPEIYGPSWKKKLRRQFETARGFGVLERWQVMAIEAALEGGS